MTPEILFCSLTTDMTDDELKECIHRMHPKCVSREQGFLLTISGYDSDPRELWEIPEAVAFCKKLVDIGFLSVLAFHASAVLPGSPGFGALEVLFMANGRIKKKAKYDVAPNDWMELIEVLRVSNDKCREILKEPCPNTGIHEDVRHIGKTTLPDGQQRHGDQWWRKRK